LNGDIWPLVSDFHCARTFEDLITGLQRLAPLYICAHAQDAEFAREIADELKAQGVDVWQLREPAGTDQDGLTVSQVMLIVVSPEAMQSETLREQWQTFREARKPIIPLLVRQTPVPAELREQEKYIDFLYQAWDIALGQLYGVLSELGIRLKEHYKIAIPPQPPLPLDGFDMIKEAQQAVWMSGLTLGTLSVNPTILDDVMVKKSELHVRLLMLDLDVKVSNEAGAWVGINRLRARELRENAAYRDWVQQQDDELNEEGHWIAQRIFESREIIKLVIQRWPDRVQVRTVRFRMGTGCFIIDPDLNDGFGMLTAMPYMFQIDHLEDVGQVRYSTSPIYLSKHSPKASDRWWFDRYVEEFTLLWKRATPWEP
ncbi:MAG: toll/interleukin-1 receptor domain-containing protein, partial [Anaerolineae bacterium]|nr:toll/interleukin-1 receptor domain-containing protein [Anaerolineae bacterium]